MMAKLDSFLDSLVNYSVENIFPEIVKSIQPYLKNPEFNPDLVRTKSSAAAGTLINTHILRCHLFLNFCGRPLPPKK